METPQAIVTTLLVFPLIGWPLAVLFKRVHPTYEWVGGYIYKWFASVTMALLLTWGGFYG